MTEVFDAQYAAAYDAVYRDKDYAGECAAITRLMAKFGDGDIRRVLDLGCGTGQHALHLAAQGLEVTGVDRSEAMLAQARKRANEASKKIEFIRGDIRDFRAERRFDAVLMNFNVLGYMCSNDDVFRVLKTLKHNVRAGGLAIADFWYGPAVVIDPPGPRLREIQTNDGRILRFSSTRHIAEHQLCEISIKLLHLQKDRVVGEVEETHSVRYFFPMELDLALRAHGFRLQVLTGYPDVESAASSRAWNAALIATAEED